jgi:hypothetical protein
MLPRPAGAQAGGGPVSGPGAFREGDRVLMMIVGHIETLYDQDGQQRMVVQFQADRRRLIDVPYPCPAVAVTAVTEMTS